MAENLHLFTNCLYYMGLLPKYNKKTEQFIQNKLKAAILSIAYATLTFVDTNFISQPIKFNDRKFKALSNLMLHMVIMYWFIFNNTLHADKLTQIVKHLSSPNSQSKLKHLVVFALVINAIFLFIVLGVNSYYLFASKIYLYILPSLLNAYFVQTVQIMNTTRLLFTVLMYNKISVLNKNLEQLPLLFVSKIIEEHNIVNNLVDLYNDIFGFESLLMKLYEMFNILAVLDFLLENSSADLSVMLFYWTFYICGQSILHAHFCERISNEGKRTINLAYNILQRYENSNTVLKKQLVVFAQQATSRCPRFTAWGFFDIDHKMIFMFVNLSLTYIIVLVQFNK